MNEFLSDEWFDALCSFAGGLSVDPSLCLTIEQVVRGDTDVTWVVRLANGGVAVTKGPAHDPDVRLSTDRDTAIGIHVGRISAQRAFLGGRLKIGGDMVALTSSPEALRAAALLFAST